MKVKLKKVIISIVIAIYPMTGLFCQIDSSFISNLNSFQKYSSDELNLVSKISCGTSENLDFLKSIDDLQNKNAEGELDEGPELSIADSLIIYKPYGDYKPREPYTQTVIELLEKDPLVILLEITTIGDFYNYFECRERYYFMLTDGEWQQISY